MLLRSSASRIPLDSGADRSVLPGSAWVLSGLLRNSRGIDRLAGRLRSPATPNKWLFELFFFIEEQAGQRLARSEGPPYSVIDYPAAVDRVYYDTSGGNY